ncbi:rhomboid family intramembrane serine protease [Flavobacterium oreochromis]|uniref:Rhomboid family intramembrane serine protease n=2 Tax=Flavobacterium TaxID=237 RepID=A0A246G7D9_9FLAO|nr:rhomboid family intramembrane serine protease [Flavobacterium oreochromis]OWP74380.1 rhomboid family intramembrane serine protease [Flavobacterium oreochromis]OWP75994.1 rhomboid family intramembrane serine protease [Flavobacterium oreochromis]POR21601.1 rhomboid family intramembrane serine protease [Flavobacterium columnare]
MNLILLLLIGIIVFISYKGFTDYRFSNRYEFNIGRIRSGEQIRIFTSGFLHSDWGHLFFNMFTLYMFGDIVINYFGSYLFLIIYMVSLLSGSLLVMVYHKNDLGYTAKGASGAVTGILYAAILLNPEMNLYLFLIPIPISAYVFGIGYLLYSIYGMKAQNDNIGHEAHFGGAIGGLLSTVLIEPTILITSFKMIILLIIPILILFFLTKMEKL